MLNIAIFGGSFDPPHLGHDSIINSALQNLDIDSLIILPAFCSPFKDKTNASATKRIAWCKALWQNLQKVQISDFEIQQKHKVASIVSVEYFKNLLNPNKIYLIIGADCLENLHKWQDFNKLSKLVEFVVATRDDIQIPANFSTLKKLQINVNISSSYFRQTLDFSVIAPKIQDEIRSVYKDLDARKN